MLHAKTAIVDERWSRVGSANLNLASWMGNYELDVVIENNRFASSMGQIYLDDLSRATEIVLQEARRSDRRERARRSGVATNEFAAA